MVNITINNQFGDSQPATLSLTNISDDITLSSICILIDNQFKCLKKDYNDERDPCEKFVLYSGNKALDNQCQLREYNPVGLPEITFYLYERSFLNITVKVVKHVECCGLFCSPLLSNIFAQKYSFTLLDQETVLELKHNVLGKLTSYVNSRGESLTLEDLRLVNKKMVIEDNLMVLKDLNNGKDASLLLLVPMGYRNNPVARASVVAEPVKDDEGTKATASLERSPTPRCVSPVPEPVEAEPKQEE
ncbi:ubiquitin, putative [Babesia ovata]|uniref:Ubiquitin, putative n=1 Tax=Babesia ovata TaxID=189622 RepID=A0A2H6K7T9_9APIC|nr:ubiquitin, putative [Babesia ovata]GBE59061.1 ubiquitin, putative [Babesia ovata]